MPLTKDTPVQVAPASEADIFEITGIGVRVEDELVTIYWRKSLSQGEGDPLIVETGAWHADAGMLGALYPDGDMTYYDNLKALAYQVLQSEGVFPEGTPD